ncbi:MAG TPA: hypothetical protein VM282_24105 [Acidimicrobiales bacterium]|nr:hypothetical protein [Acidimicrobiales bacterium]
MVGGRGLLLALMLLALGMQAFGWMVLLTAIVAVEARVERPDLGARAAGAALIATAILRSVVH